MNTKSQVTIEGQKIGKFKASFLLFKETWRFLKLDPEILFIPVISGLLQLVLFSVIVGSVALVHISGTPLFEIVVVDGEETLNFAGTVLFWVLLFLAYVIFSYFLALSQGAIAHTVMTRLYGGNATLSQALSAAFKKSGPLLVWSVINATVGVVLQYIMERSKLLGRFVAYFVGVAWSVLTYFVPPAIVIDGQGGVEAISKSAKTLKDNFSETVITNIGLGLFLSFIYVLWFIFSIFALMLTSGLPFDALILGLLLSVLTLTPFIILNTSMAIVLVLSLLTFIFLLVFSTSLHAVLKALLYAYVMKHSQIPNFNTELLSQVLVNKDGFGIHQQPETSANNINNNQL